MIKVDAHAAAADAHRTTWIVMGQPHIIGSLSQLVAMPDGTELREIDPPDIPDRRRMVSELREAVACMAGRLGSAWSFACDVSGDDLDASRFTTDDHVSVILDDLARYAVAWYWPHQRMPWTLSGRYVLVTPEMRALITKETT